MALTHEELKSTLWAAANTLRGSDPAASPDGERLVYLEYGDGTMNVVTIKLDGSEKKRLTSFHDGTWFQRPDWSPDGKSIIVSMFRNYQNVLMILDAQTGEMTPITWDSHESFDAHWAADGRIYFSTRRRRRSSSSRTSSAAPSSPGSPPRATSST